ncbi:MAG: hypothetical protein PUE73_04435 [Eubacteriales bacterium]|nr:hypothetical protein [Eubacteriales bacterium]
MKKTVSILLSILIIILTITPMETLADEQEILAQYSGSTTASWGYKPYCTL